MMSSVIGHWSLVIRVSDLIRHTGLGFLVFCLLLSACTGSPQSRQQLDNGKHALDAGQYDQAIRDADAVLDTNDSAALAEAYYLRGYAIEQRPKDDNAAAARDLAMARDSYARGLNCDPRPVLAARLHAQLGNVCYYQEDYATAVRELGIARAQLRDPQSKDLILYHIGIGLQRLGRFDDADRSFQQLQQEYPKSPYCAGARAHQGIRGFYVQVGAYSQVADIDKAASAVAAAGSVPLKTTDKGLTIVRSADVPSFRLAEQLRQRLSGEYPDARVMP
jgi:tetratricopeptide (TPR) repeat protein